MEVSICANILIVMMSCRIEESVHFQKTSFARLADPFQKVYLRLPILFSCLNEHREKKLSRTTINLLKRGKENLKRSTRIASVQYNFSGKNVHLQGNPSRCKTQICTKLKGVEVHLPQ